MKKQESLSKNFIMNAILALSSFIFPIITFPYISRVLLPEGTGKVSFAVSMISYLNMFAQLGIPTYGIRACAKIRDNRKQLTQVVHELLLINLIMSMVAYIGLIVILIYVPKLRSEKDLYIIVSSTILLSAIGMEWLYKALEKYTYITIQAIIFKMIALLVMFILVHTKEDYIFYGAITIFASSASNICNFINARKYIDWNWRHEYNFQRHLKPIIIFFAMSCATTIYTNLDTIMLGFMKNDIEVGYYNAAIKIKTILVSVITSLGTVLLPRATYFVEVGMKKEFEIISKKAINFVVVIACPMIIYFIIYAKNGIYFLSGTAYDGSILPMRIIMPTLLAIGITNIIGLQIMVPLGKEKIVLYSEIVGAFIDLVLNFIFIPKFGAIGAAIGTLVAEIGVLFIQFWGIHNNFSDIFGYVQGKKILVVLFFSTGIAVGIKTLEYGNFMILFFSSLGFFGSYFGGLLILKEPIIVDIKNRILKLAYLRKE